MGDLDASRPSLGRRIWRAVRFGVRDPDRHLDREKHPGRPTFPVTEEARQIRDEA